jgi:hypothetical protein
MEKAGEVYDRLESWYEKHPEASFGEIEAQVRGERRKLMGGTLEILVNGRDTGNLVEKPRCEKCGDEMMFEGYRRWEVHGLEGDSVLERAYYVCPGCEGETIFPPGSEATAEKRPLERRSRPGSSEAGATGEVV